MRSFFSWTSLFKSPKPSSLCFGEPTLGKLNQVKFLCCPTSSTLCDPTLANLNKETEFCITKHIPLCDSAVHTGTPFSVPRSPSETNRISDFHSSLVTTLPSRRILDKPKIEVTKVLIHHVGKNGEHFYCENSIYEYPSKMHIKSNQHMGILHAFSNCVRETFNHGLSPLDVDWGGKLKLNYTSCGCMVMEVDWGGKLKHNYISCGYMLMEVDWGANS